MPSPSSDQYSGQMCPSICPCQSHIRSNRLTCPTFCFYMLKCRPNYAFDECPNVTCPTVRHLQIHVPGPNRFLPDTIWQRCCSLVRLTFYNRFLRWPIRRVNILRPPFHGIPVMPPHAGQGHFLQWSMRHALNRCCQMQNLCPKTRILAPSFD